MVIVHGWVATAGIVVVESPVLISPSADFTGSTDLRPEFRQTEFIVQRVGGIWGIFQRWMKSLSYYLIDVKIMSNIPGERSRFVDSLTLAMSRDERGGKYYKNDAPLELAWNFLLFSHRR